MPRHTSKILQDVKNDKKDIFANAADKNGVEQTNELRYEDWQSKYKDILEEFKQERLETQDYQQHLNEN